MGKILQERQSVNINRNVQSSTFSTQLDDLVPEGKIATLPQGYMVGQVADNFGEAIAQKNFNCLINVDVKAQELEEKRFVPIPDFYQFDNIPALLERNRTKIQNDIRTITLQRSEPDQPDQINQLDQANQSKQKILTTKKFQKP